MSKNLVGQLIELNPQSFIGRPNSDGGSCIVFNIHDDLSIDVRYVLDNTTEKRVSQERIKSLNPLVTTARRTNNTNGNTLVRPSLLAPSHEPTTQNTTPSASTPTSPPSTVGISDIVIESFGWTKHACKHNVPNPLLVYLYMGGRASQTVGYGCRRWNTTHTILIRTV